MPLEFVDLNRGDANRYSWIPPFDWAEHYDHDRWWNELNPVYPQPPVPLVRVIASERGD